MDALRKLTDRKLAVLGLGIILGIVIGVLYAWVISPVQWVDGTPADLRQDLRVDYLRMVIDSYASNLDADLALERYGVLGEYGGDSLDLVGETPAEVDPSAIQKFQALLAVEEPTGAEPGEDTEAASATSSTASPASRLILPVCGSTLALGVLLAIALLIRRRMEGRDESFEDVFTPPDRELSEEIFEAAEPAEALSEQTLATFRTT
ncbi:MAG: hypothetical protein E4G99_07650, partial [Anaerolineales bacterium]